MNKTKNKRSVFALLSFFIVVSLVTPKEAEAKIYKCVNKNNKVYYNDKPCPKLDKETEIKNIKDPHVSSSVSTNAVPKAEEVPQKKVETGNKKKVTKEFMRQDAQARHEYLNSQKYVESHRKRRK